MARKYQKYVNKIQRGRGRLKGMGAPGHWHPSWAVVFKLKKSKVLKFKLGNRVYKAKKENKKKAKRPRTVVN